MIMDNRKILWLVISAMGLVILVSGIYIADLQQQLTELRQSTPETVIISDQPVEVDPQKTNIQVNNFLPQGVVPQDASFTITFSAPVVDQTLIGQDLADLPLRLNPKIPGKVRWIETNRLKFFTEKTLPPSTSFQAEVLPTILDNKLFNLIGNRVFTFQTEQIKVESADLQFAYQSKKGVRAKLVGKVKFNYPVSTGSFLQATTIKRNQEKIDYSLVHSTNTNNDNNQVFDFETIELERGDTDQPIVLKIAKGLKPVDGHQGLVTEYTIGLALRQLGQLVVESAFPSQGNMGQYLQVEFNTDVTAESLKSFIQISSAEDQPIPNQKLRISPKYRRTIQIQCDQFKPGNSYQLKILRGLIANDESKLKKTFQKTIKFANLNPSLRFLGDGMYLSRTGNMNVGLATINVNKVQLEIYKVFRNNINHLARSNWSQWMTSSLGQLLSSQELPINSVKNDQVVTPISLADYIDAERKGIFLVKARKSDQRWLDATRWVVITDLGIIAKSSTEELRVWVNSLETLEPQANVTVKLVSKNNQTLLTGKTNSKGYTSFTDLEQKTKDFYPFVLIAQKGDLNNGQDFSFLQLDKTRVSLTDFKVRGDPYTTDAYDAFLYFDRGIYRPGENANLVVLVRDEKNLPPAPFPVLLQILGPDQRIFRELRAELNTKGNAEFEITFPKYAKTGGYTARLMIATKEVGRQIFRLEEFMPDRIKVEVSTPRSSYQLGQELIVELKGINLFGPPAAGMRTSTVCDLESSRFRPNDYASFSFYDQDRLFKRQQINLGESVLDANGKGQFALSLPQSVPSPSALKGIITGTVSEPGGRAVSAYKRIDIHPYSHYIGLKTDFEGYVQIGQPADILMVSVNQAGEAVTKRKLEIQVFKLQWNSILKQDKKGRYRYQSEKQPNLLRTDTLTSTQLVNRYTFIPDEYGEYQVTVREIESGSRSSVTFYTSGWGYSPWAMKNPDRLDLVLDKESYASGEMAQLQVKAPFAGKLLITLEQDKILEWQTLTMKENSVTVDIPVNSIFSPNAYVSAILVRSLKSLEQHAPARAFGVIPIRINTEAKQLKVSLTAPTEIQPNQSLVVEVQINQVMAQPSQCQLTVAAVDEGILQLTNFQTPDPHRYFFRQRGLGVTSHDLYAGILPEVESAKGTISTGGDGIEGQRKKRLSTISVQRVKPISLWSGLITPNTNGGGSVTFKIPQFNGKLRLMAVAMQGEQFGSSSTFVTVRDPIVLTPTYPRFLAGGDIAKIPVRVFNGTGLETEITVHLSGNNLVAILDERKKTLIIANNQEKQVEFSVQTEKAVGTVAFKLTAEGNNEKTEITTELPLRPSAPLVTRTGMAEVVANQPTIIKLPDDLLTDTSLFTLKLSPNPMLRMLGSLSYLLSYPHGCVEQTTSRLFPMLYFSDLAKMLLIGNDQQGHKNEKRDDFLTQGIAKLESMMMSNGYFSYWPGGPYSNHWSSIYASHFLVEARKAGYQVSDRVYDSMLTGLRRETRQDSNHDANLERIAYACYVLAIAGQPELSTMNYLKSRNLTGAPLYQLAGALGQVGQSTRALAILPDQAPTLKGQRETGGNFKSPIRSQAIMLDILLELSPTHTSVPTLVDNLMKKLSENNRWGTTQENAFAFLALGKFSNQQAGLAYKGTVQVDNQDYATFSNQDRFFSEKDWSGVELEIKIEGEGKSYLSWTAEGVPINNKIDHFDKELEVRRRFLTESGTPFSDNRFPHGSLVVAEIMVKALNQDLDNVVVTDALPAGFEIENPRLESRAGISWLQDQNFKPSYIDIRDDRLIFFGRFEKKKETKFFYALRAITKGKFVLPPIAAEAMYDPFSASVSSSGSIEVTSTDENSSPTKLVD